jgi:hypothetical protein
MEARMMGKTKEWLRNALAIAGVLSVGYWLGGGRPVHASTSDVTFQLTSVSENNALLVYQPETKSVYVYRAATVGNATVQCSFRFVLTSPGGAIQRENCPVGSAFR